MTLKLMIPAAVLVLLSSCGGGKKLEGANAQIVQLEANNKLLTKNLDAAKNQVTALEASNNSINGQLSSCQQNAQATEQKLRSTQAVIREQAETMKKVEQRVDAALADFQSKGVDIYTKNGVVYVSMADKLLYKSGSAACSDSGKQALQHLAEALNSYPKLAVIVLGNTDDVQFKKGSDNWALSTDRANGVVRILRDAGVDPTRLMSAGKGKYNPVADNSTADGRAKNRRTDIILNPDMDRIWQSAAEQ